MVDGIIKLLLSLSYFTALKCPKDYSGVFNGEYPYPYGDQNLRGLDLFTE